MSYNLSHGTSAGNMTLSKAGLGAGTTTTITTANATTYAINGQMYSKAASANVATPTTDAVTGKAFVPLEAGKACIVALGWDASGNLKASQGQIVNTADMGSAGAIGAPFPIPPDSVASFGYILLQAAGNLATPFVFGTHNLSGVTGMTYTFRDVMNLPAQPVRA